MPEDVAELAWKTLEATEEANDDDDGAPADEDHATDDVEVKATEEANDDADRTSPDEDHAIDDTEDTATDDVQPSEEPG